MGAGGQGGCKSRIEVIVKIKKESRGIGSAGGGGGLHRGVGSTVRVDVNQELKLL